MKALVLGASGLIGNELLNRLLSDERYDEVLVIARSSLKIKNPKLRIDLKESTQFHESVLLQEADHLYCCLGSTIKKAGSEENFRAIDFDVPFSCIRSAHSSKRLEKVLLVSAMGADAKSKIFYNRVKGESENALSTLGLKEFHIFRPSLLLGDRQEKRSGEALAMKISKPLGWIFRGPLKKYKPIHARTVAHAMIKQGLSKSETGVHIHESDSIEESGHNTF